MANSRKPGPLQQPAGMCRIPARTSGPLGFMDQGDSGLTTLLGDTPGPVGFNDAGDWTGMASRFAWPARQCTLPAPGDAPLAIAQTAVATVLTWDDIKADFEKWESLVTHLYLDINGFVTVAIGNMLPNSAAAQALDFVCRDNAAPATPAQIATEFDKIKGEKFGPKYGAGWYRDKTTLDLPATTCWELFRKRIYGEFIPAVEAYYSGWQSFPVPAKRALLDMVYNLGIGSVARKSGLKGYSKLKESVNAGDWKKAATQCYRHGNLPQDRNDWARDLFLLAGGPPK